MRFESIIQTIKMQLSRPLLISLALSLISYVSAAPTPELPTLYTREDHNASLPTVKIFGTGGTIASKGDSSATTAGYSIGLTIDDLISAVPSLTDVANLDYLQVANVGSNELNYTQLIPLHHNISETLGSDEYNGAVVTHGTDTMEETAFFLDLTIDSEKPIVVVGEYYRYG